MAAGPAWYLPANPRICRSPKPVVWSADRRGSSASNTGWVTSGKTGRKVSIVELRPPSSKGMKGWKNRLLEYSLPSMASPSWIPVLF